MKGFEAFQKPLAGVHGSQSPPASKAVPGGDVTVPYGLGRVATAAMQARAHMAGERDDGGYRFHIRLVIVRNNRCGRDVRARQGLAEKRLRTRPVPFVTQQHINDLPLRIHCAIEVEFLFAAKAEDFVDGPVPADPPAAPPKCG